MANNKPAVVFYVLEHHLDGSQVLRPANAAEQAEIYAKQTAALAHAVERAAEDAAPFGPVMLEGDMAGGRLLLEGDAQSGSDAVKLESDASVTNRSQAKQN